MMTFGQDLRWRRELIEWINLQPGERVLDLGAGTGDLAIEVLRQQPGCRVAAADFTPAMMRLGQGRTNGDRLLWLAADALHLPFPEASFDVIVSGFLLRNVSDLDQALREQHRLLKPNGRLACLDTSRPEPKWHTPFLNLYLRLIIPGLGKVFAGNAPAYRYLSASTQAFLTAPELAEHIAAAGFQEVRFERRMFGAIALHWATKER